MARSATIGLSDFTTMEKEASSRPASSSTCTLNRRQGLDSEIVIDVGSIIPGEGHDDIGGSAPRIRQQQPGVKGLSGVTLGEVPVGGGLGRSDGSLPALVAVQAVVLGLLRHYRYAGIDAEGHVLIVEAGKGLDGYGQARVRRHREALTDAPFRQEEVDVHQGIRRLVVTQQDVALEEVTGATLGEVPLQRRLRSPDRDVPPSV